MAPKRSVLPFHHWIFFLSVLVIFVAIPNIHLAQKFWTPSSHAFHRSELRFVRPLNWSSSNFGPSQPQPLAFQERDDRVFISAIGTDNSDGLGHRFTMINFELNVAFALGVGYLHRRGRYGSLTPDSDPLAVERLFGWENYPDLRDEFLQRECEVEQVGSYCVRNENIFVSICKRIRHDSVFKHLVWIPANFTDCIFEQNYDRLKCVRQLKQFAEIHNKPGTIFQMVPSLCPSAYRDGFFNFTSDWLRKQYWDYHRMNTSLDVGKAISKSRVLPFNESRIQIAVHIRRGDFAYFTHRRQVPDWAYARLLAECKRIADFVFDRPIGIDVAIFSEGVPKRGGIMIANHNVSRMDPIYVTESGESVDDAALHFQRLIRKYVDTSQMSQIRIVPYIATDTVEAIHIMTCADIFIGSSSGLSCHVVRHLSRGIVILPMTKFSKSLPYSLQLTFDDSHKEDSVINKTDLKISMRKLFANELIGDNFITWSPMFSRYQCVYLPSGYTIHIFLTVPEIDFCNQVSRDHHT